MGFQDLIPSRNRDFPPLCIMKTSPGTYPALCLLGIGGFPKGYISHCMNLATDLHLVLRLMCKALLSHFAVLKYAQGELCLAKLVKEVYSISLSRYC